MAYLEAIKVYGPKYLNEAEARLRLEEAHSAHCRGLGRALLNLKGRRFWSFQRRELANLGLRLDYGQVVWGAMLSVVKNLLKPALGAKKLGGVLSQRVGR